MAKANDSYAKVLSTVDAIKTLIEELGEGKSLSDIDFRLALKSFTPTKNWTFSTNPFDFLTCLLEKFMTYDEMVEWIAKVLVYELPAIELAVKGVILAHLKAKIDCSNDPRIPEKYRMKLNPLQRIVGFTFGEGLNNLSELVTIGNQGTDVNVDVGNIVSDETMYDLATMTRGALIPIESIDLTNLLYFNPMGEMGQKKYFGTRKYYTIEDYDGKEVSKFYKYGEALKYANKHGYNPAEIINKSEVKTVWELCRAEDFNAFIWFTINKAFFPTPTIIDNNPDASGNTLTHYVYQKEPSDVFTNTLIDYDESFVNFEATDLVFPFINNDYQVSVLEHYFGDAKLKEKNSIKPFIPGNVLIQLSGVSNSTVISICFRTDVTPVGGKKSGAIKRAEGGFKVSDLDFSDIDGTTGDSVVYPINDNDYVGGILYGDPTTIDGEHHFGYARDLYLSDPDKNGNKAVISTYYKINDAYFHEWRKDEKQTNFYCNASGKTANKLGGTYMIQTHSPKNVKDEMNASENNMYKTYEAVKSYEINAYQAYRAYYDKRYKGRSFVDDYKDWAKISGDTAALEDRRQQILDIIAAKRVKKTVPYGPNEVNFFVYFPNNYSGRNDVAKDSKVKPMWYLINGSGTQTSGCDTCDKDEVRKDSNCACGDVPTTLSELGRGYEMRKDPISFTKNYSSDSGDVNFSTIKKTNKAGGTSYWHYRVDHRVTKVKNEMLDKEVLSDKGDYIDKKSFYLNSSGYTGIESVPQRKAAIEKMQKEHTLYSFADVFFALEGLNEFMSKEEKNKEFSVENDVNRNNFTVGNKNPYGYSQFKLVFDNLKDVLNEEAIGSLGSVFYSGNVESVEVVGYANSQGHKESNKLLAQDRANSVTEWLKGFSKFKNVKTSSTIDVPKINPKGNNTFDSKVWRCVKVNIKFVQQSEIEVPVDETVNFSGKTRAIANVIGFRPQEYTMEFLPVSCNYKSANWYVNRRNYFTRNITELYNLSKHPRDYGKEFSIFNLEYMKDGNTLNGYNCGKSGNLRLSIMPRPFWYMPSASYLKEVSENLGLKGLFKLGKAALPQPILFDARGKKNLFHGKYSPKVSSINPKKMLTKVVGTKEDGKTPKEEFFAFVYDVTTTTGIKVNELYITKDDYFLWNNDTFSLALSLHECYPGITVYEFNFDFVMGMRLFDARVVADRLLNTVATFRSGGSIAKDETEYQMRISNIVKNMIEADSSEVADCFFTFSNDEYEELLRKAEDRKANAMSFDDSVHKSTILSDKDISELLMGCNDNATPVEQVDILTRAINETTFTLTEEVLPEDRYNYQLNIILEMVRSLSAMIVETIFSPKVMLILEFNKIMLGDECNPGKKLTFEDIMTSFSKLIGKIVKELIETIERLMLEEILKKLLILLEKAIEAVITERMEAYLSIMRDLVENCLFIPDFGIRNLESLLDNVNYADIDSEGELKTDEC